LLRIISPNLIYVTPSPLDRLRRSGPPVGIELFKMIQVLGLEEYDPRHSAFLACPYIVYERRQPDLHRRIAVLQTAALLLGYAAGKTRNWF
jgi:hypothetical protein